MIDPESSAAAEGPSGRLLFLLRDPAFFLSHRLPIARAARAAGYDVHVATVNEPAAQAIRAEGFTHHELPPRSANNPFSELRTFNRMRAILRAVRPDILHCVTVHAVMLGCLAARLERVPACVAAISGLGYAFLDSGFLALLRRRGMNALFRAGLAHPNLRAIFQNPDDRHYFLERGLIDEARTVLIRGSGVDTDIFHPTEEPAGPVRIVLPARMLSDKGVCEFLAAARILKAKGRVAQCVLAGDVYPANPKSISRETLETWRAEGVVEWLGHCDDMPAVYAQSHIVCLPSYREGLPKALLEGAACGRALVAADVPGCREIVRDGENGLLVPARNAPALAAALERLIANATLRRTLGARGRAIVLAEFTVDRVVRATLEVYALLQKV
jgi:glycosyltransferase involved in cell wall biosynthesis